MTTPMKCGMCVKTESCLNYAIAAFCGYTKEELDDMECEGYADIMSQFK